MPKEREGKDKGADRGGSSASKGGRSEGGGRAEGGGKAGSGGKGEGAKGDRGSRAGREGGGRGDRPDRPDKGSGRDRDKGPDRSKESPQRGRDVERSQSRGDRSASSGREPSNERSRESSRARNSSDTRRESAGPSPRQSSESRQGSGRTGGAANSRRSRDQRLEQDSKQMEGKLKDINSKDTRTSARATENLARGTKSTNSEVKSHHNDATGQSVVSINDGRSTKAFYSERNSTGGYTVKEAVEIDNASGREMARYNSGSSRTAHEGRQPEVAVHPEFARAEAKDGLPGVPDRVAPRAADPKATSPAPEKDARASAEHSVPDRPEKATETRSPQQVSQPPERNANRASGDGPPDRPERTRVEQALKLPEFGLGSTPKQRSLEGTQFIDLVFFAISRGFHVTFTTGGKHNTGSKHGKGQASDIRTWDHTPAQVDSFIQEARRRGISVRDERTRPKGQKVWDAPHIHLSYDGREILDSENDFTRPRSRYRLLDRDFKFETQPVPESGE